MTDIPINPDLLARVREDIDSAKENGYDWLGTHPGTHPLAVATDQQIADDIIWCTDGYDGYDTGAVIAAIAAVRKERQA